MAALVCANAIQSPDVPGPFVSVTVTGAPADTVDALTVSAGGDDDDGPIVNVAGDDVPPAEKTVTEAVPAAATSALAMDALS